MRAGASLAKLPLSKFRELARCMRGGGSAELGLRTDGRDVAAATDVVKGGAVALPYIPSCTRQITRSLCRETSLQYYINPNYILSDTAHLL